MLTRLKIENFALIRQLDTEFGNGLNIITGETGAGKSILIGAIGLLLGERADSSVLLDTSKKCLVEGWFYPLPEELNPLLEQNEIWLEPGEALRLKREIAPAGKSRALINETVVSLSVLKEVGNALAEIHGQQDTRLLNDLQAQLNLFDAYAESAAPKKEYENVYRRWKETSAQLETLKQVQAEWMRNQDFVRFQYEELSVAQIYPGEDIALDQDLKRLESAEQIRENLSSAFSELYEQDASVYNRMAAVRKMLNKFESIDPRILEEGQRLTQALDLLREASLNLQDMEESFDSDPRKLNTLQERQSLFQRLKLKFNLNSAEDLIQLRDQLEIQVQAGDSGSVSIREKEKELQQLETELVKTGLSLEKKRKQQIKPFSTRIQELLKQVGMEGAECFPELERNIKPEGVLSCEGQNIEPLKSGLNTFRLMVRTNPGTPAGPLNSIASGGELSRIMLAIKTAIARKAGTPVMIFDEIDTGISGETALKVGRVMQELARDVQILTITHLPQIAGKGNRQYLLFKTTKDNITTSDIRVLDESGRIETLARMIGGDEPGQAAFESAKEMLRG